MGPDTGLTWSKSIAATDADVDPGRSCPPDASCVSTVTTSPEVTCRIGGWSRLQPWCTWPVLTWKDAEPTVADTAIGYPALGVGNRLRRRVGDEVGVVAFAELAPLLRAHRPSGDGHVDEALEVAL